jgi:hypothetical protein
MSTAQMHTIDDLIFVKFRRRDLIVQVYPESPIAPKGRFVSFNVVLDADRISYRSQTSMFTRIE